MASLPVVTILIQTYKKTDGLTKYLTLD